MLDFDSITLQKGSHGSRCDVTGAPTVCAMELVAWLCDEKHSDAPACVAPEIAAYVRVLNDGMSDDQRQRLKPYLPRTMNTAGDGKQQARAYLVADNAIRVMAPLALDAAGLAVEAEKLRNIAPVTNEATARAARSALAALAARSAESAESAESAASAARAAAESARSAALAALAARSAESAESAESAAWDEALALLDRLIEGQ